jgi:hypothetical protein
MEDEFLWLQHWYFSKCKETQNFKLKIKISTIDNPGWHANVNLFGTGLERKKFDDIEHEIDENDWVFCTIRDNSFDGACGPCNLIQVLKVFRTWVEREDDRFKIAIQYPTKTFDSPDSQRRPLILDDLTWMQHWYLGQCDGDWEHEFGPIFESTDTIGWCMTVNLLGTELEGKIFNELMVKRSDIDWVNCVIQGTDFIGQCGPCNLSEVLHIFRTWGRSLKAISIR